MPRPKLERHSGGRIGWWLVTGPDHDESDLYGQIELTRVYFDAENYSDGLAWAIYQRSIPERNSLSTYMEIMRQGTAGTLDEAMEALADEWPAKGVRLEKPEPVGHMNDTWDAWD